MAERGERILPSMKHTTCIILLIVIVLGTGAAQNTNPQNQEKVNVYRKYDKKKRETVTQTELLLIYGPDPGP